MTGASPKVRDNAERHKRLLAGFRELAYVSAARRAKAEDLELERQKLRTAKYESDRMAERQ